MRIRGLAPGLFLLVGLSGLASPALAQVPVIDSASILQLVNQLNEARQQYAELVSQYQQLKQTYAALSQDVNPNQWAQQLEQPLMQNSMPNTTLLPSALAGISPPSELGGNLSSLAQQYLGQNRVYQPQGQDFQARQMREQANATAAMEAMATQNLQSLQAREADLPQIQQQLNSATTIQQVSAIQARLAAEQNYVTAQNAQAANLQVLAMEQSQAQQEAQTEQDRQGEDQALAASCQVLAQDGESTAGCGQ
ncbi:MULTISPECIES: type IV secretion system protein [Acidiphilium]|uniref:type IV secretion system protein n=1 Tax=Acidiphilium TaxID=522 RepID=UPI00257EC4C2|nr:MULTISPECIES: type IV secretion system protein [Acidiphilium]HQT84932.1 type IV secretion system protein [Acidiphilium rubrum]